MSGPWNDFNSAQSNSNVIPKGTLAKVRLTLRPGGFDDPSQGILRLVMAGKKGLKKRVWSDDERRTICAQTLTPGVSVAQVARRHAMNANLIFKWLKYPRFAPVEGGASSGESIALEGVFLPVEMEASALESHTAPAWIPSPGGR